MKIVLGSIVMILLASAPAHAQSVGGALAPPTSFQTLPWTPPASPQAINVSGADSTFTPSTFVPFEVAVQEGNVSLKQQAKTLVQAAAESRQAANAPKLRIVQDNRGNAILVK